MEVSTLNMMYFEKPTVSNLRFRITATCWQNAEIIKCQFAFAIITENYENAVYKHTYEPRKGKDFELYRNHLNNEH